MRQSAVPATRPAHCDCVTLELLRSSRGHRTIFLTLFEPTQLFAAASVLCLISLGRWSSLSPILAASSLCDWKFPCLVLWDVNDEFPVANSVGMDMGMLAVAQGARAAVFFLGLGLGVGQGCMWAALIVGVRGVIALSSVHEMWSMDYGLKHLDLPSVGSSCRLSWPRRSCLIPACQHISCLDIS